MRQLNFRNKLYVTLVPMTIIAVSALAVTSYMTASKSIITLQTHNMERLVKKTIDELHLFLDDREREVVLLSKDRAFIEACQGRRVEEAQEKLITYKKGSPVFEAVFLMNTDGVIIHNSNQGFTGLNVGKIPEYKINITKAQEGQPWIGDVGKSPDTGRPVSLVTAPIMDEGRFVGIMATPVELNFFSKVFIEKSKIGESGYLFIVDSKGVTLAHPDIRSIFNVNFSDYEFGREMLAKKSGILHHTSENENKITTFQTYGKNGWIVAATASENDFLSAVRKIKNTSLVLGLAFIILGSAAIWLMTENVFKVIKRTTINLREASEQVSSASGEISSASQSLAQGTSEQAAAIEEISSSLEEMAAMTKENAGNANQAKNKMAETKAVVEKVDRHMTDMGEAIEGINKSSEETAKIIKTIDEVAFQTNLLALNAAVEAARAGETGAGFAVVADEVRNLALRAAEAARNTSDLIENTIKAVQNGSKLTRLTQEAFQENMESAAKVGQLIDEIAVASDEQAQGIDQVNKAISEMDKVVQQNAANAEESASAAEEMNAQTMEIKNTITELAVLTGGDSTHKASWIADSTGMNNGRKIYNRYNANVKRPEARAVTPHYSNKTSGEQVISPDDADFKDF